MKVVKHGGLVGALLLAGCSGGDPVDIGNNEITGEKLEDYGGSWEGYAEADEFLDGSDRVRIVLDAEGRGTLEVGDSPPLAASDGRPWRDYGSHANLVPGVAYQVLEARVEGRRLRLELDRFQAQSAWCELQTPAVDEFGGVDENGGPRYACAPTGNVQHTDEGCIFYNPATGEPSPIDCVTWSMCHPSGPVCQCDAQGCFGPAITEDEGLDASLSEEGRVMDGTLIPGYRVRLERVD